MALVRKTLIIGLLLLSTMACHAQFDNGQSPFTVSSVSPETRSIVTEQKGSAIVDGERITYWLYSVYTKDFDDVMKGYRAGQELMMVGFSWAEALGYTIDYANMEISSPNESLASSVKMLMTSRNAMVSITIWHSWLYINTVDTEMVYGTIAAPLYR